MRKGGLVDIPLGAAPPCRRLMVALTVFIPFLEPRTLADKSSMPAALAIWCMRGEVRRPNPKKKHEPELVLLTEKMRVLELSPTRTWRPAPYFDSGSAPFADHEIGPRCPFIFPLHVVHIFYSLDEGFACR